MKGELPKINGSKTLIGNSYSMLQSLNKNINTDNRLGEYIQGVIL